MNAAQMSTTTKSLASAATGVKTESQRSSTTADPCKNGRCAVADRGGAECIVMAKTSLCSQFSDQYLPVRLNDYFDSRFPIKNPKNIPEMKNASMVDDAINSAEPWAYLSMYSDQYMILQAGCAMQNQRWWITSVCIDLLRFYADRDHPCSRGPHPAICASTLDERADSIVADQRNSTACPTLLKEGARRASNYVNSLRLHPWRSKDGRCISGTGNEERDQHSIKCGYNILTACDRPQLCPLFSAHLQQNCDNLRRASKYSDKTSPYDSNDRYPQNNTMYIMIGLGAVALISLLCGFTALRRVRLKSVGKLDPQKEKSTKPLTQVGSYTHHVDNQAGSPGSDYLAQGDNGGAARAFMHSHSFNGSYNSSGQQSAHASSFGNGSANARSDNQSILSTGLGNFGRNAILSLNQQQVLIAFSPTQPDEMHLALGDVVSVKEQFDDGWACGTNLTTKAAGFFPLACIENARSSVISQRRQSMIRTSLDTINA